MHSKILWLWKQLWYFHPVQLFPWQRHSPACCWADESVPRSYVSVCLANSLIWLHVEGAFLQSVICKVSLWLGRHKMIHWWLLVHQGNTCKISSVTSALPRDLIWAKYKDIRGTHYWSEINLKTFTNGVLYFHSHTATWTCLIPPWPTNFPACDDFSALRNAISKGREKNIYIYLLQLFF